MRLQNKVAIVTGSTSGIGLATAKLFAKEGAKVVLAARKKDVADKIVEEIRQDGGEAIFIHLEVTEQDEWNNVVKQTMEAFGAIHILVNNAGANTPIAFPNIKLDDWNKLMAIDVTGPMMGIQTCAPFIRESGGGSIVNIGSIGGMNGTISTGYTTAKWALRGLSMCAAATYGAWGIRSNTINPGFIADTNLTNQINDAKFADVTAGGNPMVAMSFVGRGGQTIDLANAVLFLASDEAAYITGVDLQVDGGCQSGGIYNATRSMLQKAFERMKQE